MGDSSPNVLTLGHSTKSWQEFVDLLEKHKINILADIRRFPGSRRYPHFNQAKMQVNLQEQQTRYVHLEALGGRREPQEENGKNAGWRNGSFRGYADHMSTDEFRNGVDQLVALLNEGRIAIMCAEALPWQCHRSLVSDYLASILGFKVQHIMPDGKLQSHSVTEFAQISDKSLAYPKVSAE